MENGLLVGSSTTHMMHTYEGHFYILTTYPLFHLTNLLFNIAILHCHRLQNGNPWSKTKIKYN